MSSYAWFNGTEVYVNVFSRSVKTITAVREINAKPSFGGSAESNASPFYSSLSNMPTPTTGANLLFI